MLAPSASEHGPLGSHKILVANVAPTATDSTLREFFSFAGPVGEVILSAEVAGATQQGSVTFLSTQGAETALLLDGAMIVDRAISISAPEAALKDKADDQEDAEIIGDEEADLLYNSQRAMGSGGLPGTMPPDGVPTPHFQQPTSMPAGSEEASSAIAALIEAGYTLGKRAYDFLADFEERHGRPAASAMKVLLDLKESARQKAAEIDQAHAISANIKGACT